MHARNLIANVALTFLSLCAYNVMAQGDFSLEAAPEEKKDSFIIYDSQVELGAGYTTSDSFKFREYNGLPDKGPFVGSVCARYRQRSNQRPCSGRQRNSRLLRHNWNKPRADFPLCARRVRNSGRLFRIWRVRSDSALAIRRRSDPL